MQRGRTTTQKSARKLLLESLESKRLLAGDLVLLEAETDVSIVQNNTRADAEIIPLGFDDGESASIDIRGELLEGFQPAVRNSAEDDGSILDANQLLLFDGSSVTVQGTIGNNPIGFADYDFYELEAVEAGSLITVQFDSIQTVVDPVAAIYNSTGELLRVNDDVRPFFALPTPTSFNSYIAFEAPEDDDYYVMITGFGGLPPDPFDSFSGGTNPVAAGDYVATIGLNAVDADFYAIDLNPGDIVGVNSFGGANFLSAFDPNGVERISNSQRQAATDYPEDSPLPGDGVADIAFVATTAGTHYIRALGTRTGNYKLEMRVFRPVLEDEPAGTQQIIFLDFDGAELNVEPVGGASILVEMSPMSDFLGDWDLRAADESALTDAIVNVVRENFIEDMSARGGNPNFGITILNSRDHADPFGQPNVSRVIVGGTIAETGVPTVGIAQSVDVGNFETEETGFVLLDILSSPPGTESVNDFAVAPGASRVDMIGEIVGNIVSHEIGHYLGGYHTDPINDVPNIMDQGGDIAAFTGIGPDRVWGTQDDFDMDFAEDEFVVDEGNIGFQNTLHALAWALTAGTAGATGAGGGGGGGDPSKTGIDVTGVKWNDANGDGVRDSGEAGVAGIYIYADVNDDGRFGIGEPAALTNSNGGYTIEDIPVGEWKIREVLPMGSMQTFPADGFHLVDTDEEDSLTGNNFGNIVVDNGGGGGGGNEVPPAVAVADSFNVDQDSANNSLSVIGNDEAAANTSLTIISVGTATSGGTVSISGDSRSLTYSPASGFVGSDTFTYTVENSEGDTATASVVVTVDSTALPDAVAINDSFTVEQDSQNNVLNVIANDEAASGTALDLVSADSTSNQGGTITTSGDNILYSPPTGFTGTDTFSYTVANGDGDTASATVTVTVSPNPISDDIVRVRLETTDLTGNEITSIGVGQEFQLRGFIQDLRDPGNTGVFAAYIDVDYLASAANVSGDIVYGDEYQDGNEEDLTVDGLMNEVGGFSSTSRLGPDEQLLFTIPVTAETEGNLQFLSNAADNLPAHDILLYDRNSPVPTSMVEYGDVSITVTDTANFGLTNPSNNLDVNNDLAITALDALIVINDLNDDNEIEADTEAGSDAGPHYFVDTTGDGVLTALDALVIINFLNDQLLGDSEADVAAAIDASLTDADDDDDSLDAIADDLVSLS